MIDARSVVPQHRQRIILVGFKPGRAFEFPEFPAEGPKLASILDAEAQPVRGEIFVEAAQKKIPKLRQERHLLWMANTYTQIYIQVVFAVEGRQSLIAPEHNDELQKYITGIVSAQKHKLIAINNLPDHLHLLVGLRPDAALSELVRDIKANSSQFINEKRWVLGRFSWQEGFGAFSYSRSQLGAVIRYIKNQQKHHARKSFLDEYTALLDKFEVEYDQRYIFKPIDG
ncbi:MAG: IS200/IS605 family transposase [Verrucomicrobiae bacterium]|nr:IS200/IS605 family transposase [Verrucomicrobiae bacterium]